MLKTLKNSLFFVMILLSILACSIPDSFVPAPPSPRELFVSTTGNDSNDCLTAARACLTIPAALNKAVTATIIHVGAGTFPNPNGISVNKFVTIQGAGQTRTIIARNNAGGVNVVIGDVYTAITATLSDLTLTSGNEGLGLWIANSHLTGNNLTIQTSTGAGINNTPGARVDLTNSIISNNNIGIDNRGVFSGNHLVIQGNQSKAIDNSGAITLQNTTIQTNGNSGAGAVTNEGPTARFSFSHGTITNNHFVGFVNLSGTADITASLISANPGDGLENWGIMTLDNVEVENNGASGVFSTHDSQLFISKSAFINNGTIGVNLGDAVGGPTKVTIDNSTMSGNHSGGISASDSILDISYVTVALNNGVGLFNGGSTITMHNSIVALNTEANCQNNTTSISMMDANLACDNTLTNATLHLGSLTLLTGTKIFPLLAGSSAIDNASGPCLPVDQRGYARPHGAACDIGAYEFGSSMAVEIATQGAETPSMMPALQLLPSDTPTATGTPAKGILEIITSTPTPTLAGSPTFNFKKNAFCRKGPDTAFPDVTGISAGETVDILNVSQDGFWYFIYWKKFNAKCWVAAATGVVNGDVTGIKVLIAPGLPTPKPGVPPVAEPTASPVPCNPLIRTCP